MRGSYRDNGPYGRNYGENKRWQKDKEGSMLEFKEKVVVITGGAKGIGKCIAEEFRKEGALVEVMQFLIRAYDGKGKLDKRMEVRPRHLEGMKKLSERIISAGGLVCFNRMPIGL